jgi:molybdopterin-dependent oxidoreductase alpha subunit
MNPRTHAQPPKETGSISIEAVPKAAAGIVAVVEAGRHAARHAGILRGARTLLRTNQKDGFDCPGCAWPEPEHDRSAFEFCENGAKAVASETTTRKASVDFFATHTIERMAEESDFWLNEQGRLVHPMVRRKNAVRYEPISWSDAFSLVAREIHGLASPDEAAFYTSGRTSNEAAFLYQLFARQLGTNNLPDCSNMCHESSGAGLSETIGVGKGTVTLDDFELADAIFIVGQNPGTNHPRMLTTLEKAKKRGCTLVAINPLPEVGFLRFANPQEPADVLEGGIPLASLFLQVRINGDVAVFKGIMKAMLEAEDANPGSVFDRAFIAEHTAGFDAFESALREARWDDITRSSGVSRGQIEDAARVAIASQRTIVCWAMGLTQHKNAVSNIQEIVNFLLLQGNLGRPGAGACPVRGHSNVQGDRTMGIWERMPDAFLDRLGREFGFEPPRRHGTDTVDAITAMGEGRIKVFFAMGGNFLSAAPDTERTARALAQCKLTVHVSTKLHRGHLVTGDVALILPCLGRTEVDMQAGGPQFVTVENSMSVVSASRGELLPASTECRSEVAIVAGLARAVLGSRTKVDWESLAGDYDLIRDRIERVIPGFESFNARIRKPGGFYLGNAVRDRRFQTKGAKARFTLHAIPEHDLPDGRLLMMTIRSHDQYNTTVYGLHDRYRGVRGGRRVVFMNEDDIARRGLSAGCHVDLVSHFDDGERVAEGFTVIPFSIPRQCAATYFPEANVLVPLGAIADKSRTPASKSVVISVRPSNGASRA